MKEEQKPASGPQGHPGPGEANKDNNNNDLPAQAGVEGLKKELENAKAKCEEYLNGWKRERADFLNYKKEEMERIGQLAKYANEEIILKLLPVLDNLCLAAQHISDPGVEQIKKQLEDFLAKEGIEAIKTLDEKFDPNLMESVGKSEIATSDVAISGTVVEEVQRGYTLHGKVIRPAKVKISK